VDYGRYNPSIDTVFFPNTVSSYYWSSTTYANYTGYAWLVNFAYGYGSNYPKFGSYYVRAVRGGQCRLLDHLIIWAPVQVARWDIGYPKEITWDGKGIPEAVKISISRQGGKEGTFETIVDSTPNDGSYAWIVTGPESFNCVLKIEPLDQPDKGTTQGLFSICTLNSAWVSTKRVSGLDKYRLVLNGQYTDGVLPIVTSWLCSNESIATITGDILTAQQNGWVEISTIYRDKTYKNGSRFIRHLTTPRSKSTTPKKKPPP
jgi:hypothetical protein